MIKENELKNKDGCKPSAPVICSTAWEESCDNCINQEGRHYCLLYGCQMKNMDTIRCGDWKSKP
jgi:hypothetical protein